MNDIACHIIENEFVQPSHEQLFAAFYIFEDAFKVLCKRSFAEYWICRKRLEGMISARNINRKPLLNRAALPLTFADDAAAVRLSKKTEFIFLRSIEIAR